MRLVDADNMLKRIRDTYCFDCESCDGVRCRDCETGDVIDLLETEEEVTLEQIVIEQNRIVAERMKEQR